MINCTVILRLLVLNSTMWRPTCDTSDNEDRLLGVAQFIMGLQDDLDESVCEGELDGVSGGDPRDDLLVDLSGPLPAARVCDVMPDLREGEE